MSESPWLKVEQARRVAQCGAKLLYREIKAGRLRAARLGGRRDIRIHRQWIDEWLSNLEHPANGGSLPARPRVAPVDSASTPPAFFSQVK